jgi:hypothetical protein
VYHLLRCGFGSLWRTTCGWCEWLSHVAPSCVTSTTMIPLNHRTSLNSTLPHRRIPTALMFLLPYISLSRLATTPIIAKCYYLLPILPLQLLTLLPVAKRLLPGLQSIDYNAAKVSDNVFGLCFGRNTCKRSRRTQTATQNLTIHLHLFNAVWLRHTCYVYNTSLVHLKETEHIYGVRAAGFQQFRRGGLLLTGYPYLSTAG